MTTRGSSICRSCSNLLEGYILNLGKQPLSNALPRLESSDVDALFPLEFRICKVCGLGQIGEYVSPSDIFSEYTYFSSTSSSWLEHAKKFAEDCAKNLEINSDDLILEVASNDGYLLQFFKELGFQVLGIEPAQNVAAEAIRKGIKTEVRFFGENTARELIAKDLIPKLVICNNVMAHVPDINDFVSGLALLIQHGATVSVEAPSMLSMLQNNFFDTIYHEHFSYLSATSVEYLANSHKIKLFDLEKIKTHGGSYRYWLGNSESNVTDKVIEALTEEKINGITTEKTHELFAINSMIAIKAFYDWCINREEPAIGYGAAAKATVLLNAAGVGPEHILAVVDNSLSKQNRRIPGVGIPIQKAETIFKHAMGDVVIFPWNIANEITNQIKNDHPTFLGEVWVALPNLRRI
jgi:SAM-dependent methyltransferase